MSSTLCMWQAVYEVKTTSFFFVVVSTNLFYLVLLRNFKFVTPTKRHQI
jgi:hypothetical protein